MQAQFDLAYFHITFDLKKKKRYSNGVVTLPCNVSPLPVGMYDIENPSQKLILLTTMFDYIVRLLVWAVEGGAKV